ncbi:U4/U6 small nuclear ribonucleoprotein Prp31 isoform X2 [Equus przewalskii]|uniref:U4/U6 small nuclear ribonucleoprotein Prp31 n=2 Tax=Equus TaxID=9789 RepID=A0A9L0TUJ5_HORSE
MSLADELLADLEEAAEEEEGGSYGEEEEEPAIEDVQEETQLDLSGDSVKSIAKLWDSKMFAEIMMKIEEYISKQAKASEVMGPVEAAPEYRVIVDANNLTVEIENELNIIHKFIRDKYSKRFPELESLVPNALDYIRTVKELGNSLDKCKNNENLQQILTNATIMVVSVTASTTQGQQLSEEELERLEEACDMALELNASKHRIYEYVESRMSFIAPNLSIIIGASTAAKIMGVAGGLTNLSKMPACNIMLLGAQRKTLSGFSSTSVLPHTGYIYHSDIVQSLPPDLRRKAARLVAAKCTLAARVDSFHESTEGKVPQDEGAAGAHGDSEAGQPHELWRDRGGCLPGGPGLQPGPPGQVGQRACAADAGERGHQSQDLQDTAADPAEAERGVRREVHHPRPLLRDRLQRGLHPAPGPGDCEPTSSREEGGRGQPEVFLQHGRVPQGQGREERHHVHLRTTSWAATH